MSAVTSSTVFSPEQTTRYRLQLEAGCLSLNLAIDSDKIAAFVDYLALFHKWNKAFNLSAIRNPDEMPAKHILDSLSVLPYISAKHIIDVGTGAGLPGIPLAICLPEAQFTLLDANGKKTRFLFQAVQSLGLENVNIEHQRVEAWQPAQPVDAVICRAYSSLPGIVASCTHLLTSEGKILAMKGLIPTDELREVEKHYIVEHVHALTVPGLEGERNLIVLGRRTLAKLSKKSNTWG